MSSINTYFALSCLLLLSSIGATRAADNNPDAKLREALRNTMLQLRSAQNERAALQASQAENEAKVKALTAQVETLSKRATAAEKTASDQQSQLAKYKEAIQTWQTAYNQAVAVGNAKEAARAKLANDVVSLQRQVAELQNKNAAMFRTAKEILTRYERFGLGDALAAKEPFVGITRVKLENLVQDYQDKLLDARIQNSDKTSVAKGPGTPNNRPSTENQKDKP